LAQGVAEQDHCEVLLNEDWAERNDPVWGTKRKCVRPLTPTALRRFRRLGCTLCCRSTLVREVPLTQLWVSNLAGERVLFEWSAVTDLGRTHARMPR